MSARVTETEARAAYIAMEGRRSATGVRQMFMKEGRKVPSLRTFGKWRAKFKWRRLAAEHDAKVSAGAADQIVKDATEKVVTRASQFDTLATESLKKAIAGLTEIDVKGLKASDIRSLAEVTERAAKMYELLEGRATDRTDHVTRGKLDEQFDRMRKEIDERLTSVQTFH